MKPEENVQLFYGQVYAELENTRINDSYEVCASLKAGSRSPHLLWLIWVVWLPLIIPAIVTFFQARPTLPRLIATLVGAVLFFGIYLWAAWRRAQRLVAASSFPAPRAACCRRLNPTPPQHTPTRFALAQPPQQAFAPLV